MNDAVRKFIVTSAGAGYLPIAPGTWGSLPVCAIFLAAAWAAHGSAAWVSGLMIVVAVPCSAACVALGRFAESAFGGKDPRQCTIDESAGQALALVMLPMRGTLGQTGPYEWMIVAGVGFLAFRLFDIIKPPPGRRLEKLPFGWGVLLDDLVAAVYANVLAQLVLRIGFGMK